MVTRSKTLTFQLITQGINYCHNCSSSTWLEIAFFAIQPVLWLVTLLTNLQEEWCCLTSNLTIKWLSEILYREKNYFKQGSCVMGEIKQNFLWLEKSITLKNNRNDPSCKARNNSLPVWNRSLQVTTDSIKGKAAVVFPLTGAMIWDAAAEGDREIPGCRMLL